MHVPHEILEVMLAHSSQALDGQQCINLIRSGSNNYLQAHCNIMLKARPKIKEEIKKLIMSSERNPIKSALDHGDILFFETLDLLGFNVIHLDGYGDTLSYGIEKHKYRIVKYLIDKGADIDKYRDKLNGSPVEVLCRSVLAKFQSIPNKFFEEREFKYEMEALADVMSEMIAKTNCFCAKKWEKLYTLIIDLKKMNWQLTKELKLNNVLDRADMASKLRMAIDKKNKEIEQSCSPKHKYFVTSFLK